MQEKWQSGQKTSSIVPCAGEIREQVNCSAYSPCKDDGRGPTQMERTAMKFELWKLYTKLQHLMASDEGQDLVEYTLVVSLIALAATAAMQTVAVDVNSIFVNLGNTLNSATS
jgi:pilus assembly protein Flp/PilA